MILSRRVALDDVQLDEIHEKIVIRKFEPGTPKESLSATARMGGAGQRLMSQHYDTIDASVTYAIDVPKRQMALRKEIFDAVNSWALKKGWLTANWMANRRLWVEHVVLPDLGDPWEWLSEYTITFRAYGVPFWRDAEPNTAKSGTASSGRVQVAVGGNVESPLDITFQNRSGRVIDTFSVSAGGNEIAFLTGLGLGGSETLEIGHREDGLLKIMIGSRSVYEKYTGSDDLTVQPGDAEVSFSASRAGVLTVNSFGRWI